MDKNKVKLVLVEWEDSRQPSNSWQRLVEFKPEGISKCVSVGFLIHDKKDFKVIAPNIGDAFDKNMQVMGAINIPTTCIKKITKLKEVISSS